MISHLPSHRRSQRDRWTHFPEGLDMANPLRRHPPIVETVVRTETSAARVTVRFADGLRHYDVALEGDEPMTVISPEQSFYDDLADEPGVFRVIWDRLANVFRRERAA